MTAEADGNILVIKHGALGDFVLALGPMQAIRRHHSANRIVLLTTEPLNFACLDSTYGSIEDMINRVFDPALTIDDVTWLRESWSGKLVIKGILSRNDARVARENGVDGIILSNHGGRQLDFAIAPLRVLPEIAGPPNEAYFVYPEELRSSKRISVFRDFLLRKVAESRLT